MPTTRLVTFTGKVCRICVMLVFTCYARWRMMFGKSRFGLPMQLNVPELCHADRPL
jgi:hypothetical protein